MAARDGNFSVADAAERGHLKKILSRAKRGGKGGGRGHPTYGVDTRAKISRLVKKTDVARDHWFDQERLQILFDLYKGLVGNALSKGISEILPCGDWDDQLPDSRRSIYRAIWRELYRQNCDRTLDRTLGDPSVFNMLGSVQRRWADDETPEARIQMVGSTVEWIDFANLYPEFFPDEPLSD